MLVDRDGRHATRLYDVVMATTSCSGVVASCGLSTGREGSKTGHRDKCDATVGRTSDEGDSGQKNRWWNESDRSPLNTYSALGRVGSERDCTAEEVRRSAGVDGWVTVAEILEGQGTLCLHVLVRYLEFIKIRTNLV